MMSMGPLSGIASSAVGAPLAQTAGSEIERSQKDIANQNRQVDSQSKAEQAAGIGQTGEDQESSERDADGRRLWESPGEQSKKGKNAETGETADIANRQSKDATGQCGTKLDLTG